MRELENLVTRLVALSEGGRLGPAQLGQTKPPAAPSGSFRERVENLERSLLGVALSAAGGNQSEAARSLGLSPATFLDKSKRYGSS